MSQQVHESAMGMQTEANTYMQLVCFDFLGNGPCAALSLTPPPPLKTHSQNHSQLTTYVMPHNHTHTHVQASIKSKNKQCLPSLHSCAQSMRSSGFSEQHGEGFNPKRVPAEASWGYIQTYACAS